MNDDLILNLCRNHNITQKEAKDICIAVLRGLHEMSYKMKANENFANTLLYTHREFGAEGCYHWGGLVYEILSKNTDKDATSMWDEAGLRFDSSLKKFDKVRDEWVSGK